ncbi:hypothetical protein THRCLA_05022 [Thraustotheca clavata]|uniref:Vesicle tethering protein Uso1/P115-like head domain-containing protein n=1 Tax=Thraustotheca clavata TaxID=74557 RepID=A0A1V9ZX91_9STRA|nr:hypothetical protein THRCLA_05022 [Thraustotheca clavata]
MQHLMNKFVAASNKLEDDKRERSPPLSLKQERASDGDIKAAVEALQYAMLLAERKRAVNMLQKLMEEANIALEQHKLMLPVLLNALVTDPRDTELMEAMLELLQSCMKMHAENATFLLNEPHALREILALMQDPSPWIRGPTVQLIKKIQDGDGVSFAQHILNCHEGLRLLLEVVEDKREHIRDTAIQILLNLIKNDHNPTEQRHIQQFLAFEDGFVRLFQIVDLELEAHGYDSPVLVDCLQAIFYMIQNNANSQYLLCQTPFIAALFPLLLTSTLETEIVDNDTEVIESTEVTPALYWTIRLLNAIIGPMYEGIENLDEIAQRDKTKRQTEIPSLQNYLSQQPDVIPALAELAAFGTTPDRILALKLLRSFCFENEGNQLLLLTLILRGTEYFATICLKLDTNHEETPLSQAATALLDCLWQTKLVQISILQHILAPPPQESGPVAPLGQELLNILSTTLEALLENTTTSMSLTTRDAIKIVWKGLLRWRQLIESTECKEYSLRITLESNTVAVNGGIFLSKCIEWLVRSCTRPFSKTMYPVCIGLFRIIITSMYNCPKALPEITMSVPTLNFFFDLIKESPTEGIGLEYAGLAVITLGMALEGLPIEINKGLTKKQFLNMITEHAGLQRVTDCLTKLQQSNAIGTTRRPDGFAYAVYDKTFHQLFKNIAEKTRTAILTAYMGNPADENSNARAYQDLIRMQDDQLHALQKELEALKNSTNNLPTPPPSSKTLEFELQQAQEQIAELKRIQDANDTRFRGLHTAFDHVESELAERELELQRLRQGRSESIPSPVVIPEATKAVIDEESSVVQMQLEGEVSRLRRQIESKDDEIDSLQGTIDRLTAHQSLLSAKNPPPQPKSPSNRVKELESQLAEKSAELDQLTVLQQENANKIVELEALVAEQSAKYDELNAKLNESSKKVNELESQLAVRSAKCEELTTNLTEATSSNTATVSALVVKQEQQIKELKADYETQLKEDDTNLLLLLGNLEIQYRSFREIVEESIGKEGVEKALKLSRDRGALNLF